MATVCVDVCRAESNAVTLTEFTPFTSGICRASHPAELPVVCPPYPRSVCHCTEIGGTPPETTPDNDASEVSVVAAKGSIVRWIAGGVGVVGGVGALTGAGAAATT